MLRKQQLHNQRGKRLYDSSPNSYGSTPSAGESQGRGMQIGCWEMQTSCLSNGDSSEVCSELFNKCLELGARQGLSSGAIIYDSWQ